MKHPPIRLLCVERLSAEIASAVQVLDAGAGGRRLAPHCTTVDVVAIPGTDVVADICSSVPFPDECFDLVICTSVLEHVEDPESALRELRRVTRRGGRIWLEVPFIYHFHVSSWADRADFRRWTFEGARRLLPGDHLLEYGINVGIGTSLRLMAAETLATPLYAERHQGAYYLARWLFSWLMYPLSWLDRYKNPDGPANRTAGGFWLLFEKS